MATTVSKHILWFDPGETTGYAGGIIEDGKMKVYTGQKKFTVNELYMFIKDSRPDMLGYERFDYRNKSRKGLVLYSVQLIGIIEMYCETHKSVVCYKQMPATAINQYFNEKSLKNEGLWKENKIHANEALMHLLHWFMFREGYQFNQHGYEVLL